MSETQLLIKPEQPEETRPPAPFEQQSAPLSDLRAFALALPKDKILPACKEWQETQNIFRDWLRSVLVEGLHYGFPPGCKPKFDSEGNIRQKVEKKDGSSYEMTVPPEQWVAKPSLYKAGADRIVDLMGWVCLYKPDAEAQRQLMAGMDKNAKAVIVMRCRLKSRITKELAGEGLGARTLWQKGGDANNTLKMAKKNAKVAAVIETLGLSDLFTQDLEDGKDVAPHEAPEQKPNAPKAQPRSTGINEFEFTELKNRYCACRPFPRGESEAKKQFWIKFQQFVQGATGKLVPVTELNDYNAWTRQMINQVHEKIRMELE